MFREPIDVLVVDLLFEVEFYGLIMISGKVGLVGVGFLVSDFGLPAFNL